MQVWLSDVESQRARLFSAVWGAGEGIHLVADHKFPGIKSPIQGVVIYHSAPTLCL